MVPHGLWWNRDCSFSNELGHLTDDPLFVLINYSSDQGSFDKVQSGLSILLVSEHTRQKEAFGEELDEARVVRLIVFRNSQTILRVRPR